MKHFYDDKRGLLWPTKHKVLQSNMLHVECTKGEYYGLWHNILTYGTTYTKHHHPIRRIHHRNS